MREDALVNEVCRPMLRGTAPGLFESVGTIAIYIYGQETPFIVVSDDFPILEDAIIGAAFCTSHKAPVNFLQQRECRWL